MVVSDGFCCCKAAYKRTMNGRKMKHLEIEALLKPYLGFLIK